MATNNAQQAALDALLVKAIQSGNISDAERCLVAGASPDAAEEIGEDRIRERTTTPVLYMACSTKNARLVELLLKHGANPNAAYYYVQSFYSESKPCLIAAIPSVEIVTMLLEAGAHPNLPSCSGEDRRPAYVPLYHAEGFPEIVALLERYGADPALASHAV